MHKILMPLLLSIYLLPASAGTYITMDIDDRNHYVNRAKASLFLSRTTFGPIMSDIQGLSDAQIQALPEHDIENLAADIANEILAGGTELEAEKRAYEAWIDNQISIAPTSHRQTTYNMLLVDGKENNTSTSVPSSYRHYTWWHIAFTAEDQLRQRMAWALGQIIVASDGAFGGALDLSGNPGWMGVSGYYDMLIDQAFGNYRELLGDVTFHPLMGNYLSHVNNPKGDGVNQLPDENYAREVMQLFSIGLNELNIDGSKKWLPVDCGPPVSPNCKTIPTYDNETIKQFARVFTGLSYGRAPEFAKSPANYNEPMQMFERQHDKDEKTLLNGTVLPGGQAGLKDINDALDNLFHHPNVGPFIAKRLIQRFVMSNPSKVYVQAVAEVFNDTANNGKDRGNFMKVIKAILLHDDALESQYYQTWDDDDPDPLHPSPGDFVAVVKSKGREHIRLREPILRHSALFRAIKPMTNKAGDDNICNGCFPPEGIYAVGFGNGHQFVYGQVANRPPHVFNYYLPDYQPPGEVAAVTFGELPNIPDQQLFAPEFEILNAVSSIEFYRAAATVGGNYHTGAGSIITFNLVDEIALQGNPTALMHRVDLLLCNGSLDAQTNAEISTIIADAGIYTAQLAIQGAALSPECAIQ